MSALDVVGTQRSSSLSPGPYLHNSRAASIISSIQDLRDDVSNPKRWRRSRWRHTLGILLLLCTVFLWTASNFLQSTIFADDTYSKPFFVTYVNSAFFIIPLIPIVIRKLYEDPEELASLKELIPREYSSSGYSRVQTAEGDGSDEEDPMFKPDNAEQEGPLRPGSPTSGMGVALDDDPVGSHVLDGSMGDDRLSVLETAKLSFEFAIIWFSANYFVAACLEYTTVASSTILTSTSGIWTLLIGTVWGVERFTLRKLGGVMASMTGIVLISTIDFSGESDKNRGTFPHKTVGEVAIGDIMALISAVLYGVYAVVMKKRIGDESKVSMPLFFGLVGLFNVLLMWPLFVILHLTGIEQWELPPQGKVLTIILINSVSSLVADFCWAYAMLLTSPLIVTVGLSMTIPLSLIGQMILDNQYSTPLYWIGALVVVGSFVFVNHEESKEEEGGGGGILVGEGT